MQLVGGAHRSLDKVTPAIGTGVRKSGIRAISTKGAFKGTDAGVRCRWWQVFVAAFAIRFQDKHVDHSSVFYPVDYRHSVWQK